MDCRLFLKLYQTPTYIQAKVRHDTYTFYDQTKSSLIHYHYDQTQILLYAFELKLHLIHTMSGRSMSSLHHGFRIESFITNIWIYLSIYCYIKLIKAIPLCRRGSRRDRWAAWHRGSSDVDGPPWRRCAGRDRRSTSSAVDACPLHPNF